MGRNRSAGLYPLHPVVGMSSMWKVSGAFQCSHRGPGSVKLPVVGGLRGAFPWPPHDSTRLTDFCGFPDCRYRKERHMYLLNL